MKSLKSALVTGLIAALAVFVGLFLPIKLGITVHIWVLFLAWTSYYLYGATPKIIPEKLIQEVLGIFIAMFMIFSAEYLTASLGPLVAWPLVIFLCITPVFYLSKLKVLNDLTAYFIGMIVWFGVSSSLKITSIDLFKDASSFLINFYPTVLSLIIGYISGLVCVKLCD